MLLSSPSSIISYKIYFCLLIYIFAVPLESLFVHILLPPRVHLKLITRLCLCKYGFLSISVLFFWTLSFQTYNLFTDNWLWLNLCGSSDLLFHRSSQLHIFQCLPSSFCLSGEQMLEFLLWYSQASFLKLSCSSQDQDKEDILCHYRYHFQFQRLILNQTGLLYLSHHSLSKMVRLLMVTCLGQRVRECLYPLRTL